MIEGCEMCAAGYHAECDYITEEMVECCCTSPLAGQGGSDGQ